MIDSKGNLVSSRPEKTYRLKKDIPELRLEKGDVFMKRKIIIEANGETFTMEILSIRFVEKDFTPRKEFIIYWNEIDRAIADGIIELVEEPKWTDSQMIEFGGKILNRFINIQHVKEQAELLFKDYNKSKQEEGI